MELTPPQEEIATFFAQYLESDHMKKPQFKRNFFEEFLKVLNPNTKKPKVNDTLLYLTGIQHKIQKFELCDFTPIHKHLMEQRELKKARSKEEKQAEKEEKEKINEKYGFAMVDGYRQKVANFRIEPPGLFLGRGEHPKAGKLKVVLCIEKLNEFPL